MLRNFFISSPALKVALLGTYLLVAMFGGGLHPHSSLNHEDETDSHHIHTLTAHVHDTTFFLSEESKSQTISPIENGHQHPVPIVQLIAVRTSTSATTKSIQRNVTCSVAVLRTCYQNSAISILFVFPRETSPPLRSLTGSSDSGRSPPTV